MKLTLDHVRELARLAHGPSAGTAPSLSLDVHDLMVLLALSHGLDLGVTGRSVAWSKDGDDCVLEGPPRLDDFKTRRAVRYEERDQEQLDEATDPGGGSGPHDLGHTLFIHAPSVVKRPLMGALAEAIRLRLEEVPHELARKAKGAAIFKWLAGMKVYAADLMMSDIVRGVDADGRPHVFDRYQDPDVPTWTDDDGNAFEPLPDLDHRGTLALLEELMEHPGDHVYTSPYDEGWAVCRHMDPEERRRRTPGKKLGPLDHLDDVLGEGTTRAEAIVNALCR